MTMLKAVQETAGRLSVHILMEIHFPDHMPQMCDLYSFHSFVTEDTALLQFSTRYSDRLELFITTVFTVPSIQSDAFDSQAKCSRWGLCFGDFADLFAHQCSAYRRFQRNLSCLEIHLVRTDYLEFHSCICREIREFDPAQKTDSVFWKSVGVDNA